MSLDLPWEEREPDKAELFEKKKAAAGQLA
jgi:hypothetical protein